MSSPEDFREPDFDRLLQIPSPPSEEALRPRLLDVTSRVLRRRRRTRQLLVVAGCAVSYVAGLGTMLLREPAPAAGRGSGAPREIVVQTNPSAGTAESFLTSVPAAEVPRQGMDNGQQSKPPRIGVPRRKQLSRFESLRRLGDQYLLKLHDPEGAIRCYKMALRFATAEERKQSADEGTWLFQALQYDFTETMHEDHEA